MSAPQRLVQLVKWTVAFLLRASGFLAWLRRRRARRGEIPVLWFHRVAGTPSARVPMAVPPEIFREMVAAISRRYRVTGWDACVRAARDRDPTPHLVITFDDGYRDNAEVAWPIVRDAGGTAVFCLTTSFVGGFAPLWWEVIGAGRREGGAFPLDATGEAVYGAAAEAEIERLKAVPNRALQEEIQTVLAAAAGRLDPKTLPEALTWPQARQMAAEGAEFAAHGVSHAILTNCTDSELDGEIEACGRAMREELGREVRLFAYPNGSCDDRVAERVRGAGFTHAFVTESGFYGVGADPLRIPRIGVSTPKYSLDGKRFSRTIFEAEILGVFDVLLLRRARSRRRGY